jgi:transposase
MSFREISRRTGLSRNTVKKYLKTGIVEPMLPKRERLSLLDDYEQTLITWLHRESKRTRKQRQTLKQLYQSLILLGYTGSYDRVAAFARQWRQQQQRGTMSGRSVFVPLSFACGEAFQFDWSEDWAIIAGRRIKLQIAHFKLCHSRVFYLRAYRSQSHEMLFDAHYRAFKAERGIYDNMKTAVDQVGKGKECHINQRFQVMASHYLFEPEFCNRAAGWEKGQVEKCVLDRRHQIWQEAPSFISLPELNGWLENRCQQ